MSATQEIVLNVKGMTCQGCVNSVTRIIKKAAGRGAPVVYAPGLWRWIMLAIRAGPAPVFHKTKL